MTSSKICNKIIRLSFTVSLYSFSTELVNVSRKVATFHPWLHAHPNLYCDVYMNTHA